MAGERVSAQVAVGLQLAGGSVQLQFAQIDGPVALGVGGIHRAAGCDFTRNGACGRAEAEFGGDGDGLRVAVGPGGGGWTGDAGIQAQALKGPLAHHVEKRIERNVFEPGRHLAVDRDFNEGCLDRGLFARAEGLRGWGACLLHGCLSGDGGQPGGKRNLALQLPALAEMRNDRRNQQLLWIGVNLRIQPDAGGDHAGSNVGAAVDVHAAVGAEFSRLARAGQVEMRYACWSKGIAEDRVQELHIQIARSRGLPAGMGKVVECAGDLHGMVLGSMGRGGDSQGTEIGRCSRQVQRGLEVPLDRPRRAPRKVQIGGSGLDVVSLRGSRTGGQVAHKQGDIVGVEVERDEAVLGVDGGGAVLVVEDTFPDRNAAGAGWWSRRGRR